MGGYRVVKLLVRVWLQPNKGDIQRMLKKILLNPLRKVHLTSFQAQHNALEDNRIQKAYNSVKLFRASGDTECSSKTALWNELHRPHQASSEKCPHFLLGTVQLLYRLKCFGDQHI